jgi:hypothetical protein
MFRQVFFFLKGKQSNTRGKNIIIRKAKGKHVSLNKIIRRRRTKGGPEGPGHSTRREERGESKVYTSWQNKVSDGLLVYARMEYTIND